MNTTNALPKSQKAGKSKAVISTIIAALFVGALPSCTYLKPPPEVTSPTTQAKPVVKKTQTNLSKPVVKATSPTTKAKPAVKKNQADLSKPVAKAASPTTKAKPAVKKTQGELTKPVAKAASPKTKAKPAVERNQEDLAKLQGKWTRQVNNQRWVKEINGDKETFTIFADGEAIYGHTHTVKVRKKGPVRIYATSAGHVTIGGRKGEAMKPFSFIYKLNNDSLIECIGLLDKGNPPGFGIEIVTWNRPEDTSANGLNVNHVKFLSGDQTGTYRQINKDTWQEVVPSGKKRIFKETNRDDWSVYLYDEPQKAKIHLDLHRKKVGYSDSNNTTTRDLYPISKASAKLSGWLAKKVSFNKGAFVQKEGKNWVETDANNQTQFNFDERARDDWSVYLKDASRNVHIQLDLHARKIIYNEGNDPPVPLYDITSAN
jgi:hypothetical protein